MMPRVLAVDDQADVRAMICIVLRVNHFEIVEAGSAAVALQAFEDSSFDLAIVDIFLRGTNGFDLIRSMRERVPDLPVVAISGMTALDFLLKPELVTQAWEYFRNVQTKDQKYIPFISDADQPAIDLNKKIVDQYRAEMKKYYYDPTRFKTYLDQLGIKYPTTVRPAQ